MREIEWGVDYWQLADEGKENVWKLWQKAPVGLRILIHIIQGLKPDDLVKWTGELRENQAKNYLKVLELLESIGYEEQDEEFGKVMAGTSELFTKSK